MSVLCTEWLGLDIHTKPELLLGALFPKWGLAERNGTASSPMSITRSLFLNLTLLALLDAATLDLAPFFAMALFPTGHRTLLTTTSQCTKRVDPDSTGLPWV